VISTPHAGTGNADNSTKDNESDREDRCRPGKAAKRPGRIGLVL
jgi:hypothetical protein